MDVVRPIWEALCADTVSTLTEIKNLRVAENDCWVFMWLSDSDCIWSAPVSKSQYSSSYLFPADGLEQWALLRAHEVTIFAFVNALFENRIPVFKTTTDNIDDFLLSL